MKMPCELIVWYLLPAIRCDLAVRLKKKGMAQKKIAELFGITPAAVSQYVKSKRGRAKFRDKKLDEQIEALAESIINGGVNDIKKEICRICESCKGTRIINELYERYK